MIVISIINLKGGTAKTTTARNMSYILASTYHKRVLTCDLDCSGNLSAMFGLRPKSNDDKCMSVMVLDREADPHDYICHTSQPGLDLIAGNDTLKPADTAIRVDTRSPQQFRLSRQLKKLADEYDYCILDCPPSEDILVINALACSHEVIIPTTVNQDSLDAVIRLYKLVEEVSDYNPGLTIRGMLMTRVMMNNSLDRDGVKVCLPNIPKFQTFIRHSVEVERSRFYNLSLREYMMREKPKPFGPLLDYDNFVAEYLGLPFVHPNVPYNYDISGDSASCG